MTSPPRCATRCSSISLRPWIKYSRSRWNRRSLRRLHKGMPMRIGIVGAGMIGSTLAKLWIDAGHEVRVASRHPQTLKPLIERLGARASAGAPVDAATFGEVVMLTVPVKAIPDLVGDLAPVLAG